MSFVPADVLAPRTLYCATGSVTAKLGDTFHYRNMDWEIVGFSREMSRDSTHAGENPNVRCRFSGEHAPIGLERFVVLDNCIDFCGDSIAAQLLTKADGKPRDARGFLLRDRSA